MNSDNSLMIMKFKGYDAKKTIWKEKYNIEQSWGNINAKNPKIRTWFEGVIYKINK